MITKKYLEEMYWNKELSLREITKLDWEKEIFDIDNGLTLCERCHGGIHA